VRRGDGKTIVAGYPWFTDWGRDTFIRRAGAVHRAAAGSTTRREILLQWAHAVRKACFPIASRCRRRAGVQRSRTHRFGTSSAVHDYLSAERGDLRATRAEDERVPCFGQSRRSWTAMSASTRYRIHCDTDG
jgi:hypothetical protein